MKSILAIVLVCMTGFSYAQAAEKGSGFLISPTLSYSDDAETIGAPTTDSKNNATGIAVNLGYKFTEGFILGLNYSMMNLEQKSGASDNKSAFIGYGPMVGFDAKGFMLMFSYLLTPTDTLNSGGADTKLSGGTGMRFDVGYTFMVGDHFGIGPEISYLTSTFKKVNFGGSDVDLPSDNKLTETMLGVNFTFMM